MELRVVVLISLFALILGAKESAAISCYQCGSMLQTDASCEDPFSSNSVSTIQCAGSCTKVKGKKDEIQLVVRDCSPLKLEDKCVDETRNGVKVHVCACDSDNCNLATTATVSMATTLAVLVGRILCYVV